MDVGVEDAESRESMVMVRVQIDFVSDDDGVKTRERLKHDEIEIRKGPKTECETSAGTADSNGSARQRMREEGNEDGGLEGEMD